MKPVSHNGVGLHCGLESKIEFLPAPVDSGIYFIRNGNKLPALISFVTDTQRGTSLGDILTVEHVLSAVNGLGIDNIEIHLEGIEPPAMDGSAAGFVEMLENAGIVNVDKPSTAIQQISPASPIKVSDGISEIMIEPSDRLIIESYIDYPGTIIGKQDAFFDEKTDDYKQDIAPARTFGFMKELEELHKRGLARGASLENAVAILENGYSCALRFPNELARHKILDIMGDIALAGKRIKGKIISRKAGHKLNIELVRRLINGEG
jgi:UDP-3-O-acyl N-acetylglucosamine deacetylase